MATIIIATAGTCSFDFVHACERASRGDRRSQRLIAEWLETPKGIEYHAAAQLKAEAERKAKAAKMNQVNRQRAQRADGRGVRRGQAPGGLVAAKPSLTHGVVGNKRVENSKQLGFRDMISTHRPGLPRDFKKLKCCGRKKIIKINKLGQHYDDEVSSLGCCSRSGK